MFAQSGRKIKIGYVSPQTGPLAAFGEADKFVLAGIREALKGGNHDAGKIYPVEIIVKDSQSNPNRAAEVAADLILKDKIDLMLVASTPETTNPVSDQCELNERALHLHASHRGSPGSSARRQAGQGFEWTYHFFWGLEDIIAVFTNMWGSLSTNKIVGGLFPNDGDGNAWGDPKLGFPPVAGDRRATSSPIRAATRTSPPTSARRSRPSRRPNCEIVTGVVIPPDFKTFWTQAKQQGFKPKVASIGKALLFPAAVEALGDIADGLTHRSVVEPDPSVQVLAQRHERQAARRRLRERDQEAVDAAARLRARAVRSRHRRAQAQQERGQARRRSATQSSPPT